jgi:hypothetical protein
MEIKRLTNASQMSSAFKPINQCSSSSSSSSCSSSSSSSSYSSNKYKLDDPTPISSNMMSTSTAMAALQSHMNPFYIDKIFNFQNMFLFSNTNAANTSTSTSDLIQPNVHQSQDMNSLIQQNLMQNVYNYYNNSTAGAHLNQNNPLVNHLSTSKANTQDKGNFSIERILSMPPRQAQSSSRLSTNTIRKHQRVNANHFPPMAITAPIPASLHSMVSSFAAYQNNAKTIKTCKSAMVTASSSSLSSTNPINSIKQFGNRINYTKQMSDMPMVKSKNAKKYKCDLCGRGFSRSNTLITHRVSFAFCKLCCNQSHTPVCSDCLFGFVILVLTHFMEMLSERK